MDSKVQACGECARICFQIHGNRTASPNSYSFFKILISSSFSEFLYLPPGFSSRVLDMNGAITSLEDVNGKRWKVKISSLNGSLAFQEGWSKFISDHSISYGELLVFTYMAGSYFVVKIYGTSALERLTFCETRNGNSCKEKVVNIDCDSDDVEMASTPGMYPCDRAPRRKAVPALELDYSSKDIMAKGSATFAKPAQHSHSSKRSFEGAVKPSKSVIRPMNNEGKTLRDKAGRNGSEESPELVDTEHLGEEEGSARCRTDVLNGSHLVKTESSKTMDKKLASKEKSFHYGNDSKINCADGITKLRSRSCQSSDIKMKEKVIISTKNCSLSISSAKDGFDHSYDPIAEELIKKEKHNVIQVPACGFSEIEMAGPQDLHGIINVEEWMNEVHDAANIFKVEMDEYKFGAEKAENFPTSAEISTFCNRTSEGQFHATSTLSIFQECIDEGKAESNHVSGNVSDVDVCEQRSGAENFLEDFSNDLVDVAIELVDNVLTDELEVAEAEGPYTGSMQMVSCDYGLHCQGDDQAITDSRIQSVPNSIEQKPPVQGYASGYDHKSCKLERDEDGDLSNLQLSVLSSSYCPVTINARSWLGLPVTFPLSLVKWWECHNGKIVIMLRNSVGRLWPVMYQEIEAPNVFNKILNSGWSHFAEENDLHVGDVCFFERIKDDFEVIFQVHIS